MLLQPHGRLDARWPPSITASHPICVLAALLTGDRVHGTKGNLSGSNGSADGRSNGSAYGCACKRGQQHQRHHRIQRPAERELREYARQGAPVPFVLLRLRGIHAILFDDVSVPTRLLQLALWLLPRSGGGLHLLRRQVLDYLHSYHLLQASRHLRLLGLCLCAPMPRRCSVPLDCVLPYHRARLRLLCACQPWEGRRRKWAPRRRRSYCWGATAKRSDGAMSMLPQICLR